MPDTLNNSKTIEERNKHTEEQTSVGSYVLKQIRTMAILLAGAAVGYFSFGALKNTKFAKWLVDTVSSNKGENKIDFSLDTIKEKMSVIGAIVGSMTASMFCTYEHWRDLKKEKLAVEEINIDVANMMQQRNAMASTINHQEAVIKEIIAERQHHKSVGDRVSEQRSDYHGAENVR